MRERSKWNNWLEKNDVNSFVQPYVVSGFGMSQANKYKNKKQMAEEQQKVLWAAGESRLS